MKYEIYQIDETRPESRSYLFMGFKYGVHPALYTKVWEGELAPTAVENALESLFVRFNCNRPAGYRGRSMSVSDIVVLDGVAYFVDSFGFEVVEEWGA